MSDSITFVDFYQTPLNAGTYEVTATLTAPEALKDADVSTEKTLQLHVAGPRFSLPPTEVHSVFPPENGAGDYNNVLPHVVLERRTLPWERLVAESSGRDERKDVLESIPFLALLIFTEEEEANGNVIAPSAMSLAELGIELEPGERTSDKVNVIHISSALLRAERMPAGASVNQRPPDFMPTGDELRLLAHGRERTQDGTVHARAVVIANRLPASGQRHSAHLVMLENRYSYSISENAYTFDIDTTQPMSRFVTLKSWQFTCTADTPTLKGRLLGPDFTVDTLSVPQPSTSARDAEQLRQMSYTAHRYHLRWGDRTHTLYHGPFASSLNNPDMESNADNDVNQSAEALNRLVVVGKNQHIFDVSLSAAWELGRLLMLRDQSVAMAYFGWRRQDAQLRAREQGWSEDGHLHHGDDFQSTPITMPAAVRQWCNDRSEFRGMPFEYLVPDARMVPENSLRIFEVHQRWMQCFFSGALTVGRSGENDRRLEIGYLHNILNEQPRSGFLLRSPAVDENPDLDVGAIGSVKQLRLERISPGLLLGLYDGRFSKLEFSLPPFGLHFGFKEEKGTFSKDLKNDKDGTETESSVIVQLSENRVIDISTLGSEMSKVLSDHDSKPLTAGQFAFQMFEGVEKVEFDVNSQP